MGLVSRNRCALREFCSLKSASQIILLFVCSWLVIGIAAKSLFRGLIGGLLIGLLGGALLAWNARSGGGEGLPVQELKAPSLVPGPAEDGPFSHLGKGIIPVWARQTSAARQQTEESITGLTSQFASMQQELRQAAGSAGVEKAEGMARTLAQGQATLQGLVDSLREARTVRTEFLARITDMTRTISTLEEMSSEVAAVATQTNLLALNAAIEAAHAREHGKGFAIVAAEVRKLSERSGTTGQKITEQVAGVSRTLEDSLASAKAFTERDEAFIQEAEEKIHAVVSEFKEVATEISASAQGMECANAKVQQGISEALVHFQFQDRVSQMLWTVVQDMEKLAGQLEKDPSGLETERWLEELEQTYTTQEQLAIHKGIAVETPTSSDVTFF